ncbi:hypothetical protein ASPCADRAFT_10490 [Aspergillus carbonarius ITEM 5010]|uniref:Uncharacterized protein n=1 Tax=Aspergillus carbonarius (strain ITEM 5010) TaxID=602072 RepID=A0A1R3R7X9_ASPC5|nr:hypothetical protein ASPCADRAFT_10490 [Aspergillus carbonarius ITEM 5010]
MRSIPIVYNLTPPRVRLAPIAAARVLGKRLHGGKEEMKLAYQARVEEHERRYRRRMQQWENNSREGKHGPRPRYRPVRERLGIENDDTCLSMNATVPFAYWDRKTRTLEPGTYCRACTYHWEEGFATDWNDPETMWDQHPSSRETCYRAFLEDDLPEPFHHCAAVKANYDFNRSFVGPEDYRREQIDFIVVPNTITV